MSHALESAAEPATYGPQSAHPGAQPDAAADAVLIAPCALDLPVLSKAISRTFTLSLNDSPYGTTSNSLLSLAAIGCDLPSFEPDQDMPLGDNLIRAASAALGDALQAAGGPLRTEWWGSVEAAREGQSRYSGDLCENGYLDDHHADAEGCSFVIEFDDGKTHPAIPDTDGLHSSDTLRRYESICPGFTHLLYTVLEQVSDHVWPIYTPRTLWNDYVCGGYSCQEPGDRMCDLAFAKAALEQAGDDEYFARTYGIEDYENADPDSILDLYSNEIGSYLPSDFLTTFGRAAIGHWPIYATTPVDEPLPCPQLSIWEDLAWAQQNMALRDWCPDAAAIGLCLDEMARIVRDLRAGARLAEGAEYLYRPSSAAIQLCRFGLEREELMYRRVLDDAVHPAQECGNEISVAGWACLPAATPTQAQASLQKLRLGAGVLQRTLHLINHLFS